MKVLMTKKRMNREYVAGWTAIWTLIFGGSGLSQTSSATNVAQREAQGCHSNRYVLDMVYHNPGERRNVQSAFLDPKRLKDWGFNGAVPHEYVQCSVPFERLDPSLFPKDSKERVWMNENAKGIDLRLKQAKEQGVAWYPFTDFIVIPKKVFGNYKSEITDETGRIDIQKSRTQAILREQIREIFDRFPDLEGLTVRYGETYLNDIPYHMGDNPIVRQTRPPFTQEFEKHALLINLLREEVCVKRNKQIFYRTWDTTPDKFHDDANYYLAVTSRIKPHPKLAFSIKHQWCDFHRLQKFNETLGIGDHPQIVEVCCQLDSYGKGAHPYYIGQGVIEGWEEYEWLVKPGKPKGLRNVVNRPTYAGTWTWSRGGGWRGPFIENEFWCELNTYVVTKWGQNPNRTEEEVFNEFAREIAGIRDEENLKRFRRIALLSAAGTVRGQNSLEHKVDVWWTRDEYLGFPEGDFKNIIAGKKTEAVLREKAVAVEMWREIERLSRELNVPDERLAEYLRTSCTYGRIKFEIIQQGWIALLRGIVGDKSGSYDWEAISDAIRQYDQLWEDWRALKASSPSCATLYQPMAFGFPPTPGLGAAIDHYRDRSDFIRKWRVSRSMPKEGGIAVAPYRSLKDPLDWEPLVAETGKNDGFVNVHPLNGNRNGIRYLATELFAKQEGRWQLLLGHDGGARVFLDGHPLLAQPHYVNPVRPGRTTADVWLSKGKHELMVAFDTNNNGWGRGIYLQFEHPDKYRKPDGMSDFPVCVLDVKNNGVRF